MIIRNIEQQTDEWHAWRAKGVGGSEIATLFGCSPFVTSELALVKQRLGLVKKDNSWVMKRGLMLEPQCLDKLFEETGLKFRPALAVMDREPICRSSLDGITDDDLVICEVKNPISRKHHDGVGSGEIPIHIYLQCQYNLMVSGAHLCYLISSFYDKYIGQFEYLIAEIKNNPYCADADHYNMMTAATAFFKRMEGYEQIKKATIRNLQSLGSCASDHPQPLVEGTISRASDFGFEDGSF